MVGTRSSYRFDGIQALRFLAAIMVVFTHSLLYASERLGVGDFRWSVGGNGVDIFFVISGFVMVISSRYLIDTDDGWRVFLKKRIVRIVPLYWGATSFKLLVLLLMSSVVLHADLNWWTIFKSYFFIPSKNIDGDIKPFLGVGWTLVFEMFFYVIFTIALLLRQNIYKFVGLVLLAFSIASLFRGADYSPWWYLMNPIILEFYSGMILGYLALNNRFMPSPIALALFILSLAHLLLAPNIFDLPRVLQVGIPATVLVWSTLSLEGFFQNKIPRPILFFGAASYALYLFHPLVAPLAPVILAKLSIGSVTVSVFFSVTLALVTSAIVHVWFEKPVTKFLSRY